MGMGTYNPYGMNMLGLLRRAKPAPEPVQPSMIESMLARANAAPTDYATLAQLFPYINTGYQQYTPNAGLLNTSSSGAGRFLGNAEAIPFNFNAPPKA